jgi:DNA-binding CsgD family transcriptional regulator
MRTSEVDVLQLSMSGLVVALIDRLECGLLVCDAQGRVHHANAAARRELRNVEALHIVDGRVRCAPAIQDAWSRALHDASVRHRSQLLPLETEHGRLILATMPLDVADVDLPLVLVMMGRRQVCSPLGMELLASHHGLTFAESRVLRALVDNLSPREIAASHGVAIATIRTQISAVRDKLGVRSIDALLLRAAAVPPLTGRH